MAKKKHHHRKGGRRRSRVGAINKGSLVHAGETLVGLVAGSMVATAVQKAASRFNPKIISIAQIVGGMYLSKRPSPIMAGIGYGVASAGAIGLSHELGVLAGIEGGVAGIIGANDYEYEIQGLDNNMYLAGLPNNQYVGMADTTVDPTMVYTNPVADDIYNPGVQSGMGIMGAR